MKITADYKGRNDEYDDETIRYYSEVTDKGYFYELYILVDGKKARLCITKHGLSVEFKESGETIHTNLVPRRLYPGSTELTWSQISSMVETVEKCGLEGKRFSMGEMEVAYKEWKKRKK